MSRTVIGLLLLAACLEGLARLDGSAASEILLNAQSRLGGVSLSGIAALFGLGMWAQQLLQRAGPVMASREPPETPLSGAPRKIAVSEDLKFQIAEREKPKAAAKPAEGAWGEDAGGAWGEEIESLAGAWGEALPLADEPAASQAPTASPGTTGDAAGIFAGAAGDEWLPDAMRRAKTLDLGPGAVVKMAIGAPVPFTLQLVSVPHDRRRRAIEKFVSFLANIATPPRVSIHYRSCNDVADDRYLEVSTLMQLAFPKSTFKAYRQGETIEVIFLNPDPRWEQF